MKYIKKFLESDSIYAVELVFKCIYILHLLLCFNPYIDGRIITKVTLVLTMALGVFVLLGRLLLFYQYRRTPGILLLVLFVASFIIPSVFIYRYALVDSLKTIVWMTFHFGILFAFNFAKDTVSVKKELKIVSIVTLLTITAENIVSVAMAFTGYFKMHQKLDGSFAVTGLAWWGRLYGVHGDPNYSCVYTLVAIAISVYLFLKYRSKLLRLGLVIAALVNFMYISFTASRTGIVTLTIASIAFSIIYSFGYFKKNHRILKIAATVVVVVVLLLGLNKVVVQGFNVTKAILDERKNEVIQDDSAQDDVQSTDDLKINIQDEQTKAPTIGRSDEELNGDITNRRSEIWKSGLQIFAKNPVIGIGFENILGYTRENLKDSYIINNDLKDFDAFHNVIVDVLVSQGIIGILLVGMFAVIFLIYFIKNIGRRYSDNREEFSLCFAICVSMLASAVFLSHIFYVNIATTGLFWLFAGYFVHLLYIKE